MERAGLRRDGGDRGCSAATFCVSAMRSGNSYIVTTAPGCSKRRPGKGFGDAGLVSPVLSQRSNSLTDCVHKVPQSVSLAAIAPS